MATYQTKPRKQLIDYLKSHPDQSFTAEELTTALKLHYHNDSPGKSTVYRLIRKLEQEGLVKRFDEDGSNRAYYRFTDLQCCDHLHLKCTGCGKLIHMKSAASHQLLADILRNDGFAVDGHQTILFGKCNLCNKEKGLLS